MSVELHCAFVWDCDECGKENFVRAIEGNLDEAALMADENQVVGILATNEAVEADGEMMESESLVQVIAVAPKVVKCSHCGATHQTELGQMEE